MRNAKKLATPRCGAVMSQGKDARKKLGWKRVSCDLSPGHIGNHAAWTKTAVFEWWNKAANPQREANDANAH